jgi:hypothetical protein
MNKLYLLAITLVIAGLLITSATSMPVTSDLKDTQSEPQPQYMVVHRESLKPMNSGGSSGSGALPLFAGQQITAGEYDEYRPSISVDASGRFFIAFEGIGEDLVTYYPIVTYSEDGGATWADAGYWPDSAGSIKPDVDCNTHGFYGTFDPPAGADAQIWFIDATDITNILGGPWDFTGTGLEQFENMHIGTYTHEGPEGDPGVWNFGGIAFTGYNGYQGADVSGCPYILYPTSDGYATIGWITNTAGCKHASFDIDQLKNYSYAAYDQLVTGKYQLLVRKDNFGGWTYNPPPADYWTHPYVNSKKIIGVGNLTYPDVIAELNHVIIVAQSDEAGNQDIVCYYSANGGSSYANTIVTSGAEDEISPQLAWIKEGVAVCTYLKGTEAYFRKTTDYGATWSDETRVSDEVIDPVEDHAMSICGMNGNAYAIWQDGRGDNVDIYWDLFTTEAAPNVQIGTVAGGIGKVTMEVKNIGTGAASNVPWTISVKGGILHRINVTTSDVISSIAAGGAQTVQTDKFIFGFGALSVQLTAGAATGTKTGRVILILVKVT